MAVALRVKVVPKLTVLMHIQAYKLFVPTRDYSTPKFIPSPSTS